MVLARAVADLRVERTLAFTERVVYLTRLKPAPSKLESDTAETSEILGPLLVLLIATLSRVPINREGAHSPRVSRSDKIVLAIRGYDSSEIARSKRARGLPASARSARGDFEVFCDTPSATMSL